MATGESRSATGAFVLPLAVLVVTACAMAVRESRPPQFREPGTLIWIVGHGWHAGVALPRERVPLDAWPGRDALGPVRYLEIGWGDGEFYPAPRGTIALALRAAFRSTSSVLHVAGFDAPVATYFAGAPVLEVELSPRGLERLGRFIDAHQARDAAGQSIVVARGIYGDAGHFYLATGRYHVFDNSNHWTARALRAAGCPIEPAWAINAGTVLSQVREFSRPVRLSSTAPAAPTRETEDCRAPR